MAEETVIDNAAVDRNHLCMTAVWELDKIARILPALVPLDDDQNHFAVKALAGRMLRLTSALMDGLGDKQVSNEEVRRVINFEDCISQG